MGSYPLAPGRAGGEAEAPVQPDDRTGGPQKVMQDRDEMLLAELVAFAGRALPRCPPGIDPHHFGTRLAACQYLGIAKEVVRIAGDGEVLDWGTGFGHVAFLLARLGREVRAFDVTREFWDVDPGLLQTPGVTFDGTVPGAPLPYPDGAFATALSVGTLEHCPDEPRALHEIHRVLRPGGRFLVYHLPNRFSWIERLARRAGRFYHERTYRPAGIRALFARHGLEVDAIRPYHVLPRSSFSRVAALRAVAESRYRAIDGFDRALARVPPLSLLCTAFTVHARRPDTR